MKRCFYRNIILLFCFFIVVFLPVAVGAETEDQSPLPATRFRFIKVRPGDLTRRNINWESVPGAEGYELYISEAKDGQYSLLVDIADGNIENYVYGPEPVGGVKYYKVRPYVSAGGNRQYGAFSQPVCNASQGLCATRFRFVKVRPGQLTMRNINWIRVPGADGYELYDSAGKEGQYTLLADITDGNVENYVYGLEPIGGVKYYKVRPYVNAGGSRHYAEFSQPVCNASQGLCATRFRFVKVRSGDLTRRNINWESVPGAEGYELHISDSRDGQYSLLADIGNGGIDNYVYGPEPIGGVKYYKVRPYINEGGGRQYGGFSQPASNAPEGLPGTQFRFVKARPGNYTRRNINWVSIPGAEGYEIFIADSANGNFQLLANIANGNTENYVYGPEPIGGVKYYKVRPYMTVNGQLCYGKESPVVCNVPTHIPSTRFRFIRVRETDETKRNLNWEKVPEVSGYELYYSQTVGGNYSMLADIPSGEIENYVYGPEQPGGIKYYKVRAYQVIDNQKYYGEFSQSVSTETPKATHTHYHQGDSAWGFSTTVKKKACVVTAAAMLLQNNGNSATPRTVLDRNGGVTSLFYPSILPKFGARPVPAVSTASPYFNGFSGGRTYIKNPATNAQAAVTEALKRNPEGVLLYFDGDGSHAVVAIRCTNGAIFYSDPGRVEARGHNVTFSNTWVQVGHSMGYGSLQYMLAID